MTQRHYSFNQKCISVCVILMYLLQIYRISGAIRNYEAVNFSSRILGGDEALRGQWPFIAALFKVEDSSYFCGGTVITNKHVLTTASCIQGKGSGRKLSPNDVKVKLGAFNLTRENEQGSVWMNVSKIFIHPDWNVYDDAYDADVAILVLNQTILFTNFIQKVSLPADNLNIDGDTINVKGIIVGWGIAESRTHEEIPRQAEIQTMNNSYCYLSDPGVIIMSSRRTFCGKGNEYGKGKGTPNNGDSGGGFFVDTDSGWVQYGIISASRTNGIGQIVRSSYSVYGNVKEYKNWIDETTEINDQIDVDLTCTNRFNWRKLKIKYQCDILYLNNQTENSEITSFTITHKAGKTEEDVDTIKFPIETMFFLPNGIGEYFKRLKSLQAEYGLSNKCIGRSNLQNLQNLEELYFNENKIEVLDVDALRDLAALEIFQLKYNKVKVLHEGTFDSNRNLRHVLLNSNQLEVIPRNLFRNNNLLEKVDVSGNNLKSIEIDFTSLNNVWYINLKSNVCIDALYSRFYCEWNFSNLAAFQNVIVSKCTSSYRRQHPLYPMTHNRNRRLRNSV